MHKLVNVLRVTELEPGEAVERELALIKVTAPPSAPRRADRARARSSGARRRPRAATRSSSRSSATPEELDSFEELVRPHGVKELVRTGRIGLGRASAGRVHQPAARPR